MGLRELERALRKVGRIDGPVRDGRNSILLRYGARSFEFMRPGSGQNGGGGARGTITGVQSRKSRKRQMCDLLEWKDGPQAWQTFTFPDEDMEGRTIRQRSVHGQVVKDRFVTQFRKTWPLAVHRWKKEWKGRKSGAHVGEYVPHYHFMYRIPGMTEKDFVRIAIRIAEMWVRALQTQVKEKAWKVATFRGVRDYKNGTWKSKPSFEWLEGDKKKTIAYSCKYMGKAAEEDLDGEETGRAWGGSRGIPRERQAYRWIEGKEEVWLARLLWRKWKRRLKGKNCRKGLRKTIAELAVWGAETRETMCGLLIATWDLAGTFRGVPARDCPF
jgi:hypothetical protein